MKKLFFKHFVLFFEWIGKIPPLSQFLNIQKTCFSCIFSDNLVKYQIFYEVLNWPIIVGDRSGSSMYCPDWKLPRLISWYYRVTTQGIVVMESYHNRDALVSWRQMHVDLLQNLTAVFSVAQGQGLVSGESEGSALPQTRGMPRGGEDTVLNTQYESLESSGTRLIDEKYWKFNCSIP